MDARNDVTDMIFSILMGGNLEANGDSSVKKY